MTPTPRGKSVEIDADLHSQLTALADFQRRSIKSVLEHMIKKAISNEAEKDETED